MGDHHETGHGEDLEHHYRALLDYAHEHFAVRSVAYRWSAQDFIPVDGVPYVGRLLCSDRIWAASGFKKWGLSNGVAAARIMTDGISGRDNAWAEVFDVKRLVAPRDFAELVRDNSRVAARFIGDRLTLPGPSAIEQLEPGDGVAVRSGHEAGGRVPYHRRGAARGRCHLHPSRLRRQLERCGDELGLPLPRIALRRRRRGPRRTGHPSARRRRCPPSRLNLPRRERQAEVGRVL